MLKSTTTKFLFNDIRFWILLLFVLRLYGIWFPPLEVEHNWRQTTVTMVARNFYEMDANIFFPRVDMAGELTGITGMEFPLLNYLIYLVSLVFGYQHWYGRLIVLMTSSVGIWYFYLLIQNVFSRTVAFNAAFMLLFSLWLAYSRKIMPDTFATSLAIMGLYYGLEYLDKGKLKHLLPYFCFGLLGLLAKLPAVFLFVFFLIPMFKGKLLTKEKIRFTLISVLLLLPVIWWYFTWVPYLTEYFGFWHFFMGKSYGEGLAETIKDFDVVLKRLFFTPLGFSGLITLLVALIYLLYKKKFIGPMLYGLGLITFFGLVVLKAGWTFHHHNYYILAFIPVFVLPIALALEEVPSKLKWFLLTVIAIEGVSSQYHEFRIKEDHAALLNLEPCLDKYISKETLIIINSENYPTPMYFAHRKGWTINNRQLGNEVEIKKLIQKGAKLVVVLKKVFGTDINLPFTILEENEDYKIYSLE